MSPKVRTQKWSGGDRLRKLREERGWSRRDVEAALIKQGKDPISPSTLEKWENGIAEPTGNRLAVLAQLYGVTLDYLFLGSWVATVALPISAVIE